MGQEEVWKPIPGWQEYYEASSLGRIRSFDREVNTRGGGKRIIRGRVLKPGKNAQGYPQVSLVVNGKVTPKLVHRLIALTFYGVRPDGFETRHLDDNKENNCLTNLAYGTKSENMRDKVRNGRHHNSSKTCCVNGHEFSEKNTRIVVRQDRGGALERCCRACMRDAQRVRRERMKEGAA